MNNSQLELIKTFAPVFADMAAKEDKSKLDANIYRALFLAQMIILGEFGSKEDAPKDLVDLAWTKEDNKVVDERWASRLCYASEKMPNITIEEISSLADEFIRIVRNGFGTKKKIKDLSKEDRDVICEGNDYDCNHCPLSTKYEDDTGFLVTRCFKDELETEVEMPKSKD